MSMKTNGAFRSFKALYKAIFGASVIIYVIFFIVAAVSSLLGYSLWSWMNVLRFFLGAAIVLILGLYIVVIKSMLFNKKLVKLERNTTQAI